MKKQIALLLVPALTLSLFAGCRSSVSQTSEEDTSGADAAVEPEPAAQTPSELPPDPYEAPETLPEDVSADETETETTGTPAVLLPEIRGLSFSDAQAVLRNAGFTGTVTQKTAVNNNAAPGTVIGIEYTEGETVYTAPPGVLYPQDAAFCLVTATARVPDDVRLTEYLRGTLAAKYGTCAGLRNVPLVYRFNVGSSAPRFTVTVPDGVTGLVGAALTDMDGNGAPELFTVRLEPAQYGMGLVAELYSCAANETVARKTVCARRVFADRLHEHIRMELLSAGGKQYLLVYDEALGDGVYDMKADTTLSLFALQGGNVVCVHRAGWESNRFGKSGVWLDDAKCPQSGSAAEEAALKSFAVQIAQAFAPYGVAVTLSPQDDAVGYTGTQLLDYLTDLPDDPQEDTAGNGHFTLDITGAADLFAAE